MKKEINLQKIFELAFKNHEKKNFYEAKNYYNQILEIEPNHFQSLALLGALFLQIKEFDLAKPLLEKVVQIDPNNLDANNNLGIIFKELGESKKAIKFYEKAIEINPNYIHAKINLGIAHQDLGDFKKAVSSYEKAIEINPNYAETHNNLGALFQDLGDFKKAVSSYEKAIEINPNYAETHNNLAFVQKKIGEYPKAIKSYQKAIEINPNNLDANKNLGEIFKELREYPKAIKFYEKAIEINPNNLDANNNLGEIFKELREYPKAINYFGKVIKLEINDTKAISNLYDIFSVFYFATMTEADHAVIKESLLHLFRKNNINHVSICKNAIATLPVPKNNEVQKILNSKYSILDNKTIQSLLKEELLLLVLKKTLIVDSSLEKILTKLREKILFLLNDSNKNILNNYFDFITALSEQSLLNEYIHFQSKGEIENINKLKNKIENSEEINEIEIALLGCYIPLKTSKIILNKLFKYKSKNILFNNLITTHIKEPLKEAELRSSIKSLGNISDTVSIKVKNQYEENPYPRWKYTNKSFHLNFLTWLNVEIKPNKVSENYKFDKPDVLIAGCGTGRHTIASERYLNSNILGIDLSLTSLVYAKRKILELGFKNIEFLHADILQLKELNKKFDVIESVGTLHHMRDPLEGLKVLTDILKPGGFLKLGLYSEIGRIHIARARELIKKENFKSTIEDIRVCRQVIFNKEEKDQLFKYITFSRDFYSTSTVRDLLFHVQEHRFKIPEISKILKNLDLEFLGFVLLDPAVNTEYSRIFPEDKKNISLDNWNQFEIKNPATFAGMYQFWVRKK